MDSNLRKDMPTQRRQHKKKWKIIIWAFNGHKRKDLAGRYQDGFKDFKALKGYIRRNKIG